MATKKSKLPAGVSVREDGRYHVRVTVTDPVTTKRVERKKLLDEGATLAEAVALREGIRGGALEEAPEDDQDPRVGDYARSWLKRKLKRWRPRTAETWVLRLEHHVLPFWGSYRVSSISRRLLLRWRDQLQEQIGEYSEQTVKGWWTYGIQLLRDAIAEHDLVDCTQRVDPPAGSTPLVREVQTLSREEVVAVVEAVRRHTRHWIVLAVAAYTGCRLGEAIGLRWADVDLGSRLITIRTSLVETRGGGQSEDAPKNGRARVAAIPEELARLLEEHRGEQPGIGEAFLAASSNGRAVSRSVIYQGLRAAMGDLQITQRVSPQVLRRTWVTLAVASGVDHQVLRSMVGHADAAMTEHYHGARAETLRAAAGQVWPAPVAREEVE